MPSVLPAVHCCYWTGRQSSTALAYLVYSSPRSLAEPQGACRRYFDSATSSTVRDNSDEVIFSRSLSLNALGSLLLTA